ncbi:hypothetical protein PSPO01_02171 [Paraphaeosphaeria sporulosa]
MARPLEERENRLVGDRVQESVGVQGDYGGERKCSRRQMGTRERRSRAQTIARHAGPTTPSQSIRPLLITGRSSEASLSSGRRIVSPGTFRSAMPCPPILPRGACSRCAARCTAQELPGPILQVRRSHHIMSPPSSANNRLVSAQLRRGLAHIYGAVPRRDDGASDPQPFCIYSKFQCYSAAADCFACGNSLNMPTLTTTTVGLWVRIHTLPIVHAWCTTRWFLMEHAQ